MKEGRNGGRKEEGKKGKRKKGSQGGIGRSQGKEEEEKKSKGGNVWATCKSNIKDMNYITRSETLHRDEGAARFDVHVLGALGLQRSPAGEGDQHHAVAAEVARSDLRRRVPEMALFNTRKQGEAT